MRRRRALATSRAGRRLHSTVMKFVAACQLDSQAPGAACFQNEGKPSSRSDFLRQPGCWDRRLGTGFDDVGARMDLVDTCYANAGINLDVSCGGIAEVVDDRSAQEVEVKRGEAQGALP